MSIRLRLTLLYTAILALTLVVFSLALYVTVEGTTNAVLKDGLAADMARLVDTKEFRLGTVSTLPMGKGKPVPFGTYVQTTDASGQVLDSTKNTSDGIALPALSEQQMQVVKHDGYQWSSAPIADDQWLIYSKWTKDGYGREGIVHMARPLGDAGSLGTLRRNLIVGGLGAVALAFGVGFFLARTALRPIGRITATARTIETSQDFGRRVDYRGPQDEVGQLATTFNAMLAALQRSYEQTEGALQAQRRFVADASHELRTPLTTIRGNLGLLGRTPPISTEDRRAALADMVEESERMSRLIDNLLTLARADSGRPLRAIPVPVAGLLDDACRQARLLAPSRAIVCAALPDWPAVAALGDPDALRQILLILLDNAIKYTPESAAIEVAASIRDKRIILAVRDGGPGIPPAVLPHLFERFYRADSARTSGGAGLGLAIARALAEGQGGTIAVDSGGDEGSIFTVTVPQALAAASVIPELAASSARP